ncbi:hypothetical protein ACFLX7_00125 [Chloroflexota bacterium]
MAIPDKIKQRAIELSNEGRSAGKVLEALGREFKDEILPDERTIRRWRKAQPAIPVKKEQETLPSSVHENWKEHFAKLADVAISLLANDLETVLERQIENQVDYTVTGEGGLYYTIDRDDLSKQLEDNLISTFDKYQDWFIKTCFNPHLEAELPEEVRAEGLWDGVIYEKPYELIDTLRILIARKTFKGTCPVCKDW